MKAPHLCWVLEPPARFEPLTAAACERDLRVGWLHLAPFSRVPELEPAVRSGMSRALAVGAGASLSLKPIPGEPVLADLIRGHFLGCALVLISGDPSRPGVRIDRQLAPARLWSVRSRDPDAEDRGSWKLVTSEGRERVLTTEQLVGRLRRPRL